MMNHVYHMLEFCDTGGATALIAATAHPLRPWQVRTGVPFFLNLLDLARQNIGLTRRRID